MARLRIKSIDLTEYCFGTLAVSVFRVNPENGKFCLHRYRCTDYQIANEGKHPGHLMRRGLALLAMAAKRDMNVDLLRGE